MAPTKGWINRWWNTYRSYFPLQKRTMQAHQPSVFAYSAVPFVHSLMISGDNRETDPGGRTRTQTNQLLAYKRIEHSNLSCGLFQMIADMLRILVLISLSALVKNCLCICTLINSHSHTYTHLPHQRFKTWSLTLMLWCFVPLMLSAGWGPTHVYWG